MNRNTCTNVVSTLFLIVILSITLSGIWVFNRYQSIYDMNLDLMTDYQTIRAADQAILSINEASVAVSAFLATNDEEEITKLPEDIISAQLNMQTMRQLINDNKTEQNIYNKLLPMIKKKIEFLQNIIQLYKSGNKQAAFQLASDKSRFPLSDEISRLIIDIRKIEIGQIQQLTPAYQLNKINADMSFIIIGLLNILLLLFTYLLMKQCINRTN